METKKLIPFEAVHPTEILKNELKSRNIKFKDFAKALGMKASNFSRFLSSKTDIDVALANKLQHLLPGISSDFWLDLQKAYYKDKEAINQRKEDLSPWYKKVHYLSGLFDIYAFFKHFGLNAPINPKELIEILENFLGKTYVSEFAKRVSLVGHFRRTMTKELNMINLSTWMAISNAEARQVLMTREELNIDRAKKDLSCLFNKGINDRKSIEKICLDNGIIYIELEHLPKTYVDGYSFMRDDGIPVLVTSRRFKKAHDRISFYVMHELGHIALHLNKEEADFNSYISVEGCISKYSEEEEANTYAADALISADKWNNIKGGASKLEMSSLKSYFKHKCKELGLNYDIAIGRYKHEINSYNF